MNPKLSSTQQRVLLVLAAGGTLNVHRLSMFAARPVLACPVLRDPRGQVLHRPHLSALRGLVERGLLATSHQGLGLADCSLTEAGRTALDILAGRREFHA